VIAVSTATVDQKARWALWDSFTEIAATLLNIAAFIALPFVPFLGELMLAYMAYQLLDETFEGVIDWAEGHATEALGHFMGVVESVVQLGAFAVGGGIAAGEFRAVLPREIVQFIDRFNVVKTPRGATRYWEPDLSTYEHSSLFPKDSKPDALGLYRHQDKTLLALENKRYAVNKDALTGQYRIDHPSRSEAYKPVLKHNGEGAWLTELDQPLSWDQATLLQRIGPDIERFSLNERERLLTISGCHENVLRKMQVNMERLPPLLADTLKRFKIEQDIQIFIDRIGSEQAHDNLKADPVLQFDLLYKNRGWPDHKGLQLIDGNGQPLWSQPNIKGPFVPINITRLHAGDLLKTLLLALNESEIKALLGEAFGEPPSSLDARARTLRRTLVDTAESNRTSLFGERYRKLEPATRPMSQTIIDAEPDLPKAMVEAILDTASGQELQQLQRRTLSKRLENLTKEAGLQVRVTRAYEGLDLKSTAENPDTCRLTLHTLERLPGWSGRVRVEIRHYSHTGSVFDSIGSVEAPELKILVLNEEGFFQPFDRAGLELGGSGALLRCLLQALPDSERINLDLQIGEEAKLQHLIRRHAINRQDLRSILVQNPILKPSYDPAVMRLLGGADGYHRTPPAASTLQARTHSLFPHLSPEQLQAYVERLQQHPNGPRAELTRLIAEHSRLYEHLQSWIDDIPRVAPDTQVPVNPEQLATQRRNRMELADELQNCWHRQATYHSADQPPVELYFSLPITGDLPQLNADFANVTNLVLQGSPSTRGVHDFLRNFSGLHRLVLRHFQLDRFPEAIEQCSQISELILSDCAITLTPQSQTILSSFQKLQSLDLYKNPLGVAPDLSNMPDLNYIDMSETAISELPNGLLTRPNLRTALLNGNQIRDLPQALFGLSGDIQSGIDLGENPIGQTARERLKQHFLHTGHDLGIFAEHADIQRLQALYPRLDQEQASDFIYSLPGTLVEGRAELTRLETEYETLTHQLAVWTADIPPLHPETGAPFTDQQLSLEQWTRDEFKELVERCWRREPDPDEDEQQPGSILTLMTTITGDLPALNADFSHVIQLHLHSSQGLTTGANRFLENFPRLKSLSILAYRLDSIPDAIFRLSDLTALALSNCNITLSAQTVLELAQMDKIDYLDLSHNPLGAPPDLSQMADLSVLLLTNTGISELPPGLPQLQMLDLADLSDNAITHIPREILELPMQIGESIVLRGNPISAESLQTLITYFQQTTVDFGLESVIEQAELEVSDSEDSEIED